MSSNHLGGVGGHGKLLSGRFPRGDDYHGCSNKPERGEPLAFRPRRSEGKEGR